MDQLLSENKFQIKAHAEGIEPLTSYSVYYLDSGSPIMNCIERDPGFISKVLRFTYYKKYTPFIFHFLTVHGQKILSISRGFSVFGSEVKVYDESNNLIGKVIRRFFSFGRKLQIFDSKNNLVAHLKGKWSDLEFTFTNNEHKLLAKAVKKISPFQSSASRTIFTIGDDNYVNSTIANSYDLVIESAVPPNDPLRKLILASVICIDMVLKE